MMTKMMTNARSLCLLLLFLLYFGTLRCNSRLQETERAIVVELGQPNENGINKNVKHGARLLTVKVNCGRKVKRKLQMYKRTYT